MKTFEEIWAVMKSKGYQYGSDALEQVKFGWELGLEALKEARQDDLDEIKRLSEEIGRIAKQSATNRAVATQLKFENVRLTRENAELRQKSEDFRTVTITRARLNELENMLRNAEKERDEYYSAGLRQAEELESLKAIVSRFKERYNALPAIPNVQQWHGLVIETMSEIEGWVKVGEYGLAEKEPSDTWHPDTLTPVQQRIVDAEQILREAYPHTPLRLSQRIVEHFDKHGVELFPKDQNDSSAKATEETTLSAKSVDGEHVNVPVTEAEVMLALKAVPPGVIQAAIRHMARSRWLPTLREVLELELMRRGEKL